MIAFYCHEIEQTGHVWLYKKDICAGAATEGKVSNELRVDTALSLPQDCSTVPDKGRVETVL